MFDVMRAELFKLARRPAAYVLLAAAVVLSQVFGFVIPYLSYRSGSAGEDGSTPAAQLASTLPDQVVTTTVAAFPIFAGALALVLGALVMGSEFGWGTVKTMFTQGPRRAAVLGGQLLALSVAVLAGVGALFATCAVSAVGIALVEGQDIVWPTLGSLGAGLGAGVLVMVMWACLGGMLGLTLRNVALPIGLGVVWILGVENLISAVAGTVLTSLQPLRDLLPGVNAGSLIGGILPAGAGLAPGVTTSVSEGRALATVLAYAAASVAIAVLVGRRRDVV